MFAHGSLKAPESEITRSVSLVAAGNFLVSILAVIVVFGTLGYLVLQQNLPVTGCSRRSWSVFVVFPEALNLLPHLTQ